MILSIGEVERRLLIYGARNPGLLIYKDELAAWARRDDISLNVTVDKGDAKTSSPRSRCG